MTCNWLTKCINQETLDRFMRKILPWIVFQFVFTALTVPAAVLGALTVNNDCLNYALIPTHVWLFVYMTSIVCMNVSLIPAMYLLTHMKTDINISKRHIAATVVGLVLMLFVLAWCGVGIHIYRQTTLCSYYHAPRLILANVIIWFGFTGLVLIGLGVGLAVFVLTM